MGNPFRFRGQRKGEIGGFVTGWWYMSTLTEGQDVIRGEDGLAWRVKRETLSISTGKTDSTGMEIFASFEIDGVMTTGGDAVSVNGNNYNIKYSPDLASFIAVNVNGKESGKLFHYIDIDNLTIIGKQGGGNDRRLNIMAQIGMERTDLHT